jgi:hypothetical protein
MARVPLLLTQFRDAEDFLCAAQATARAQRSADRARAARLGAVAAGTSATRDEADLCLAYSIKDGYFYVGYSGMAGSIVYRRRRVVPARALADTLERRPGRLHSTQAEAPTPADDLVDLRHALAHCAEACAWAVAMAWRQQLADLAFVIFSGAQAAERAWTPKEPCASCLAWLPGAHAYHAGEQLRFAEACLPRRRSGTLFQRSYDSQPLPALDAPAF